MASRNNQEGSSEKKKGSSSSPVAKRVCTSSGSSSTPRDLFSMKIFDYDEFLDHAAFTDAQKWISEWKDKTWLQNDWTHEEDSLLKDLLKQYWTREELDGSVEDLFKKYGNDEMYGRYGEIAKNYFPKRSAVDVSWRHSWFKHVNRDEKKLNQQRESSS